MLWDGRKFQTFSKRNHQAKADQLAEVETRGPRSSAGVLTVSVS